MRIPAYALAVFAVCHAAAASASPDIQSSLVWQNLVKAGHSTELRVTIDPPPSGPIEIHVNQAGQVRHFVPKTNPQGAYDLPIMLESAEPIEITVQVRGSSQPPTAIQPEPISGNMVVSTLPITAFSRAQVKNLVIAEPDQFPNVLAGYGNVDLVVLDISGLRQMSAAQQHALRQYHEMCGRMITIDLDQDQFTALSVCAETRIALTGSNSSGPAVLATALQTLLSQPPLKMPAAKAIAELRPTDVAPALQTLAFGLILYLVAVLVLARWRGRAGWLMGMPIVVSALIVLMPVPNHKVTQTKWSETVSGSQTYRFVSAADTLGLHRGSFTFEVEKSPMPWRAISRGVEYSVTHTADTSRNRIEIRTRLLERQALTSTGVGELAAPLTMDVDAGSPVVANNTDQPSLPAELIWKGTRYAIPALPSGTRWTPETADPVVWSDTPRDRLLRQRTALIPGAVFIENRSSPQAREYLLIRP